MDAWDVACFFGTSMCSAIRKCSQDKCCSNRWNAVRRIRWPSIDWLPLQLTLCIHSVYTVYLQLKRWLAIHQDVMCLNWTVRQRCSKLSTQGEQNPTQTLMWAQGFKCWPWSSQGGNTTCCATVPPIMIIRRRIRRKTRRKMTLN